MWLTSCQKENLLNSCIDGAPIYLSAITEHSTDTRAPYEYTSPNDGENGVLHAAIWASSFGNDGNGYTYPNPAPPLNGKNGTGGNKNQVAIHATADFDSDAPQLLNQAVYPKAGTTVFFVGLHPQSGWSVNADANKANFKFNGSNDVMYAPRIKGQYAESDNTEVINVPELQFHHLLTWLKVRIKAENDEVIAAWGKITKMEISSDIEVEIDLSDKQLNNGAEVSDGVFDFSKCKFSNPGKLNLYKAGSDDVFATSTGYTMSTANSQDELAYVLCSPVDAIATKVVDGKDVTAPEYTLYIETENRRVELPIDLKKNANEYYTGNTRGKHFTLNLTFKIGNTIIVTARADDWEFGGTGNVEL